jgi:hypothetical protein
MVCQGLRASWPALMAKVNSVNRLRGKHPGRPPDGKLPASGAGMTAWADPETQRLSPPGERPQRRGAVSPSTTAGQRPPGAGRALAGGFGPPAGLGSAWRCGRGDGPCQRYRASRHSREHRPSGREKETHCVSPPARYAATKTVSTRTDRGQRPTRRARSARRWRGGRWPGALGPRRAWGATWRCGRGDGPCQRYRASRHSQEHRPSGRDPETHCVSPPARDAATKTGASRTNGRPAPDPAGEKRPPGAGRALAGGFGPPAGLGSAWRCGRGDGPCQSDRASRHSREHRPSGREKETHCVSPPARDGATKTRATRTNRGQRPARRRRSARRGGAGAGRTLRPPAGQGSARRFGRGDGPCRGSDAVPPPLR